MINRTFRMLAFFLIVSISAVAEDKAQPAGKEVQHLATALDHITVLEFGEPVTQAAAGSSAFNIEWRQNKVLIKPMKPGASTDLFVWTASRRFAYELDPPGEAKNMNYAVDNAVPASKPAPTTNADAQMAAVADMVLTRAFLGAERIDSSAVRNKTNHVVVRIDDIFRSANGLYVRYSISNFTTQTYSLQKPSVSQLSPLRTRVSLLALKNTQVDSDVLNLSRDDRGGPLPVAGSEVSNESLAPGETGRGVIILRQQFTWPTALELAFPNTGARHVTAVFIF
jgi:Conjugal transfer protein